MYSRNGTAEAVGCPIRRSSDQSLLAAPQGLTQPVTSFIASQCQGIHQMPFRHLITLNHTQGTKDRAQRPDVRDQIPSPNSPKQSPTPRMYICAVHNGSHKWPKLWRGLKTRASTGPPTNHRTNRTRDRQKTCQQRRRAHGTADKPLRHIVFFTSSSQYQRTQTQSSELRVQVSERGSILIPDI